MVVKINRSMFMMTFDADADYHTHLEGQETYLDKESGDLVYAVSDLESAAIYIGDAAVKECLESDFCNDHPEKYLKIPSMVHGEHHSVMQDFLASNWIADKVIIDYASSVYYSRKSIGYWLKNVDDQRAIDAYFAFREVGNLRLAEEFLRGNGVPDFVWT